MAARDGAADRIGQLITKCKGLATKIEKWHRHEALSLPLARSDQRNATLRGMPASGNSNPSSIKTTAQLGLIVAGHVANVAADRLDAAGPRFLDGDRTVEWAFCFARLADGPGRTLDFGADISMLGLAAAMRGHEVVALDRMPSELQFEYPALRHESADILDRPLAGEQFDQIINCSSVEHVGLAGRYESFDKPDGDIEAMRILSEMLSPSGRMILTIPVGQDGVFSPYHRVYGPERLPALLAPFTASEEQYWCNDVGGGAWIESTREQALELPGSPSSYALGLFILGRNDTSTAK